MQEHLTAIFLASLLIAPSSLTAREAPSVDGFGITPRPAHAERGTGECTITQRTSLRPRGVDPFIVAFLQGRVRASAGFALREAGGTGRERRSIRIAVDSSSVRGAESYRLEVDTDRVMITGGGEAGAFYGVQALLQLVSLSPLAGRPSPHPHLTIPCCRIEDAPRFRWRGMHLDVSRHFFSVGFIRTYIDMLAMHRLNVFHWHLTDDQGWRIEIKKYPELTRTGAWRVDREGRDWSDRPPAATGEEATYGGYYTQEEIREIVRYAAERYVTIVPEIEMPAHALAALASYPAYSCSGGPFTVPPGSYWPISTIFCAGNDSTFAFLDDVLSEVMDLFPGRYIHIGGDEADKGEWRKCPKCQTRIGTEGLTDESGLQSYFIRRIASFVSTRGRRIIGWDEILEGGGLPPGAAVMSWRGEEGGIEAAVKGHDVVMTPGAYTYLSENQGPEATEPQAGGGYLPLSKVYAFEPVPDTLKREEWDHVLGAEGCLWTEYIATPSRAEYMLLPRLAALAEAFWSPREKRNWDDFVRRVPRLLERYDAEGYAAARSAYGVRISSGSDRQSGGVRVSLSTEIPADSIVYTTDGSEPTALSRLYAAPFTLRTSASVKAAAVVRGAVLTPAVDTILFHRGMFKNVSVTYPATRYTAGGPPSLTDGLIGSLEHDDGRWQGYEGVDFEAVMDLAETTDVSGLGIRFLEKISSWIFFPSRVTFAVSADGNDFAPVGSIDIPAAVASEGPRAREWDCAFPVRKARYVRFNARTIGTCPAWHPGAGGKAWLFVDELIVR